MITDARALRPEYVPRDLHHRDGQIDHLSSVLAPARIKRAENVCIFGPSGAGKTTIAKYTLEQLEREVLDLRWGYVNCMADNTPTAVFHELLREVNLGADLRREGTPRSTVLDRLRDCDDQIIAILDEVATLNEQAILALYEIPGVSLICITIDEDEWFNALSQQTKSRMRSAATVRLDKYSHDELVDILDSRVVHGLLSSRVADGAIDYIADIAAGDARRAIAILRRAAVHVDNCDERELTTDAVDAIVEDAEKEVKEQIVRSLGTHHRILLRIIDEAGRIDGETLHARYEDRAQSTKSRSTRWRYLNNLESYDLIESHGDGRGAEYVSLL